MAIDTRSVALRAKPKQAQAGRSARLKALFAARPRSQDRAFFTEQIAMLLESGTPLHPALLSVRRQTVHPAMAAVIDDLIERVTGGMPLSVALGRHPEVFPATYVNLVGAAESGGFLHRVLQELINMEEKRDELRRTVTAALSYPGFLLLFSIAVVIFVLVVVFPKFATLFEDLGEDKLPMSTLFLLGFSNLIRDHWLLLLVGLGSGVAIAFWWLQSPAGKEAVDNLKMRTFILKDIFVQTYLIQTLRVMGLSLENGLSVPDMLVSCREVVSNRVFRRFLDDVEKRVAEGGGFAVGFNESRLIPVTVKQMVTTGEETGNLPVVLNRVAAHYERELGRRLATFSRIIEPVMLVLMAALVGLIVSALILPIFKLSSTVG